MANDIPMSRTRGTICGLTLVLLGAWGGLAPLIGPYFTFGFLPDHPWHYSLGRLYLSMIPGGLVLLAGLAITVTKSRWVGGLCALVAALGGAWFIAGQTALRLITGVSYSAGAPIAGPADRILLTSLACFAAVGMLIVFFAAMALGRQSVTAHKDYLKFGDLSADEAGGLADLGLSPGDLSYDPYQPISYQEPVTGRSPRGTGAFQATTASRPVVGGQTQFPSQYPASDEPEPDTTKEQPVPPAQL